MCLRVVILVHYSSKLKTRLTGLDKIKHIMSKSKKKNIVQGVFKSVLCYCLPLFGGCNKSEMSSLQVQQNKAAQIVLNFPPRTNRGLMFDQLEWLTVHQLIAYHTLILVYRIRSAGVPEDLAATLSRDNHNGHINIKNTRLELYRNSFIFRGALLWNKLPRILRVGKQLGQFKTEWIAKNIPRFDE